MVRLTVELLDDAPQYVNPIKDRELNLRNYKIPVIENMGVTRDQFDTIDLTDNDIKKLENFPILKRLNTLYLHNNRIHFIQPEISTHLPNLRTLTLTNNNICELGDIDPLSKCKKLEYLTFVGNPITHKQHYRLYIIYRIPSVRVLDFRRIKLAEREAAKKMFKGKKNKTALEEIGKKSNIAEVDKENEGVPLVAKEGISDEDKKKIEEAIRNAKSLQEVEYLQSVLASGRIPESGWNMGLELTRLNSAQQENQDKGFQPEVEQMEEGVAEVHITPEAVNGTEAPEAEAEKEQEEEAVDEAEAQPEAEADAEMEE